MLVLRHDPRDPAHPYLSTPLVGMQVRAADVGVVLEWDGREWREAAPHALVVFIEARLAEIEQHARNALDQIGWDFHHGSESAAGHDLDEVASKRGILAEHDQNDCCGCRCYPEDPPCPTVRWLAWPYRHHPDWRPEWMPVGVHTDGASSANG